MLIDAMLQWRGDVVLTRDLTIAGERSEFFSRVRRGEFVAVLRGAYVSSVVWNGASADERHLLRIAAAEQLEPASVFSHDSAAAVWRLPSITPWPERVHVLHPGGPVRSTTSVFFRHESSRAAEPVWIDGRSVTDLARTVIDVAATRPFPYAVAMADAALRRTVSPAPDLPRTQLTSEELIRDVGQLSAREGSARALRAVRFADGAADRPGESVSRCSMSVGRITPPELQVPLLGASGARYFVDFWWEGYNHIGEFDGRAKYRDPLFLRGRTPERALLDEKYRQDDLLHAGYRMTRWTWEIAVDPRRLRMLLNQRGVS